MDTNLNPLKTTTSTIGKALSWKNVVIVALCVIAFVLILSYVIRLDVVTYDNNGNEVSRGEIKPTWRKIKKSTTV